MKDIPRTLVVTNDFPPRVGGVQQYVWNLVSELPADKVAVMAPRWEGWREHDEALPFRVQRFPTTFMWPTRDVAGRTRDLIRQHGADVVFFGAALPLALLGRGLGRRGIPHVVATHGFEYWTALTPVASAVLSSATSRADHVLAISRFTAGAIRQAVPSRVPLSLLPPGVDAERFHPDLPTSDRIRAKHRLGERPLVVCVSRLVPRKGQDVLIKAMPAIMRRVPDAHLLVVGDGPDRARLQALAADAPRGSVTFTGQVPDDELPAYHAAADVFAMPCRSRKAGLEVEGFGIVFLEAAACGKPTVAGDSGGAAEAVVDGETGLVVDGKHPGAVAEAVSALLADPVRAEVMGKAGRARVERSFAWPLLAERLAGHLVAAAGR